MSVATFRSQQPRENKRLMHLAHGFGYWNLTTPESCGGSVPRHRMYIAVTTTHSKWSHRDLHTETKCWGSQGPVRVCFTCEQSREVHHTRRTDAGQQSEQDWLDLSWHCAVQGPGMLIHIAEKHFCSITWAWFKRMNALLCACEYMWFLYKLFSHQQTENTSLRGQFRVKTWNWFRVEVKGEGYAPGREGRGQVLWH